MTKLATVVKRSMGSAGYISGAAEEKAGNVRVHVEGARYLIVVACSAVTRDLCGNKSCPGNYYIPFVRRIKRKVDSNGRK